MTNNRNEFYEQLSRFSRYYGVQVTATDQRTAYSTPPNWTIGVGSYDMQRIVEPVYKLEVRETELRKIVETVTQQDREEEMRHHIPALKDAWSKYQMLLALYTDYAY